MSKVIFTDAFLRGLSPPAHGRLVVWAAGYSGFGVRVGVTGRKSFISKINSAGQSKIITHGIYPAVSLRVAIDAHEKLVGQVTGGAQLYEIGEISVAKRVDEAIDEFHKFRIEHGYKDARNQYNMLVKDVAPYIGSRQLSSVGVKDIRHCFDMTLRRIQKERPNDQGAGLSHIKHLQVAVRGLFRWAVERGFIEISPASAMETVGITRVRERVLEPSEIYKFWHGIGRTGCTDHVVLALRMMLVTGQRGKEVKSLKWSDLSGDGKVWTISAATAKNKRMHRVPLGEVARGVIAASRPDGGPASGEDIYIFGGKSPLSERALSKALRRNRDMIGVGDITPHDLRRTAATLITAMGLPSFYASLLLNHAQQGVTNRVYVQYSYDTEKQKAISVLDKVISEILSAKSADQVLSLEKLRDGVKAMLEK